MIYNGLKKLYIGLILLFLYAPIFTLIVLSFNASKTRSVWGGFSFVWYVELVQNEDIMQAALNTLMVATISATIATILGLLGCIAVQNMSKKARNLTLSITNIPMLNAEIVTGISLMLLFITLKTTFGFTTVLLSHITFCIPYVILSIFPRMRTLNMSMYEAALDLGATKFTAFIRIMLPDLMPGILAGFLLAFTMSLDDFIVTYFTTGPGFDTLSTMIYSEIRKGIKPEMYALSTIIFAVVFILLLVINKTPGKKEISK